MKILITGGAGQVGTDLLHHLHDKGGKLSVFDLAAPPDGLPAGVRWSRGSVDNPSELYDAVKDAAPEVMYHFAALLSATGEKVPHRAYAVNMDGTRNALEAARLFGVRQVMFASTIAVFGPGLPDPVPDDVPLLPSTIYGVTKVAGELLGAYYKRKWGLDFRGVRFPGLINAGVPGGGTTDYALHMYVDGIRSGRYECYVGPESTVPMMYMPDALRALVELSEAPAKGLKRCIYNIAALSPTAADFAKAVKTRVPGVEITYKVDPARQAILDSWPKRLDDSCARADWGWRARYDLDRMSDDLVPKIRKMVGVF
ncbi:MAG TPA: NAD-dependent epimerase/dehydratase family protein [Planctomycetota bacterium]|nr:NAD-dependent epimerase/dehydratase family protein [Planctomycetota bacterium]